MAEPAEVRRFMLHAALEMTLQRFRADFPAGDEAETVLALTAWTAEQLARLRPESVPWDAYLVNCQHWLAQAMLEHRPVVREPEGG
jgi:hypothetical protein